MDTLHADTTPGFRRRFRVTPSPGRVLSEVEDDFHCMSVGICHDGGVATTVQATLARAPWSTCPGSVAVCERTFTGLALRDFATQAGKSSNCTHLFDLAQLAAAHAFDDAVLVYDIFVSDPVDDTRHAELYRNGDRVLEWSFAKYAFVAPAALAGCKLNDIRQWLGTLPSARQEEARVLRWASIIAHGRTIPLERQSNASAMPPSCYSFQPENAAVARRIGTTRDFSQGLSQPLSG